ncbi:ty3-gypsy retrotransposon protein [Cucumis melo var. makuwa]|uniref:Ty3-gypsy retrotransposon protein n=1 Tax=Cucumis melo var. makuwa TaxID=1194695 RepID=A0A5D3BMA9_CUCMM|nr:ty3-gypsy retrotransposon protein [Cucumis melo var. makuwa]
MKVSKTQMEELREERKEELSLLTREGCGARKPTTTTISLCCFPLSSTTTNYDNELHQSSIWRPVLDFFHGLRGDQLVRQFVRSLKENAFEWYTDLELEVINDWEQLKKEFFNRFYSTRRVVSMMELTNTKQLKGESVIDYINQQRALCPDCKDKITELSTRGKVDDPKYYKYHQIISHPVEKCFVLKELILKLARENKIELDIDEVTQTNHVPIDLTSSVPPLTSLYGIVHLSNENDIVYNISFFLLLVIENGLGVQGLDLRSLDPSLLHQQESGKDPQQAKERGPQPQDRIWGHFESPVKSNQAPDEFHSSLRRWKQDREHQIKPRGCGAIPLSLSVAAGSGSWVAKWLFQERQDRTAVGEARSGDRFFLLDSEIVGLILALPRKNKRSYFSDKHLFNVNNDRKKGRKIGKGCPTRKSLSPNPQVVSLLSTLAFVLIFISLFLSSLIRNISSHLYVQAQASNPVSLEVGRNSSQRSFIVSGTERGEDEAHDWYELDMSLFVPLKTKA